MPSGEIVVISVSGLVGGKGVLRMCWVFLRVFLCVLWVLWVLLILFMQSESVLDAG